MFLNLIFITNTSFITFSSPDNQPNHKSGADLEYLSTIPSHKLERAYHL